MSLAFVVDFTETKMMTNVVFLLCLIFASSIDAFTPRRSGHMTQDQNTYQGYPYQYDQYCWAYNRYYYEGQYLRTRCSLFGGYKWFQCTGGRWQQITECQGRNNFGGGNSLFGGNNNLGIILALLGGFNTATTTAATTAATTATSSTTTTGTTTTTTTSSP